MSVIMTMRVKGDASLLEKNATAHPEVLQALVSDAVSNGAIAHRFYGSDNGDLMVCDEWPDAESFQRFFAANKDKIEGFMTQVGVTTPPEITFWHKLDTRDDIGWGA